MAMKKRTKSLIAAIAAVVILAGALTAILYLIPKKEDPNQVSSTASYTLYQKSTADVERIEVSNESGSFVLNTVGTGSWTIEGLEKFSLVSDDLKKLVTSASTVKPKEKAADDVTDFAQYGLDKPASTVTTIFKDGSVETIHVGTRIPGTTNYYIRHGDDTSVYVNTNTNTNYLLRSDRDYISKEIIPINENGVNLLSATFSGSSRTQPMIIRRATEEEIAADSSLRNNVFRVIAPHQGGVDFDRGGKFVQKLNGLTAVSILAYNPTAEDLAKYGLDNPYSVVEYETQENGKVKLSFGQTEEGNANEIRYVYKEGTPLIYSLDYASAKWVEVTEEEMISPLYFTPSIDDVQTISVTSGGKDYTFKLSTNEDKSLHATCNGEPVDETNFRSLFRLMISLPADSIADVTETSGTTLVSFEYQLKEANDTVKIALVDAGNRRAYISKNGEVTHTTRAAYADKFESELQKFLRGETVSPDF